MPPDAYWAHHFETDLEIAATHLAEGDEVHLVFCDGDLLACEANPEHEKPKCDFCVSRCRHGLDVAGIPTSNRHRLNLSKYAIGTIPRFSSIEDLKAFKVDGVDLGLAVASSLISLFREPHPDLEFHREFVEKSLNSAWRVYLAFTDLITKHRPDRFYLFNGRFAAIRPALRAAQRLGVRTLVHERGRGNDRYLLTENTYVQDLNYRKREIHEYWDQSTEDEAKKIETAESWFTGRRGGKDQSWVSFTKEQTRGLLPVGFDRGKKNIVIFSSSEDEYQALEDWANPFYKGHEREGLQKLLASKCDEAIHFYLRIHPNQKELDNSQTRFLKNLKAPNLTLIEAGADIDTYSLIEAAEKVVSFGSTTSVEATFWGRPSLLLSRALYEDLDVCYVPTTHEEALRLLHEPLMAKSREGTLKYGYWCATLGKSYRFYEAPGFFQGTFKGKRIIADSQRGVLGNIRKWLKLSS